MRQAAQLDEIQTALNEALHKVRAVHSTLLEATELFTS